MGKKVDLNQPRQTNNSLKSNRHSNSTSSSNSHISRNNGSNNNLATAAKQKIASSSLQSVGVPPKIAQKISENEEIVDKAFRGKGILKMPLPIKISLALLPFLPVILLLFFLIIVLDEDDGTAGGYGNFAYGQTCTTITVTDTGCTNDATECTNEYDGEVSLEDYIAGVVNAEVGSANNLEYYKVAAIAARTYFLNHVNSSCTVKGNTTFQAYKDVEENGNGELIRQAVEETKGLVLIKNNELMGAHYASACVTNADDDYYYVRYGTISQGQAKFQQIPKEYDETATAFKGYLNHWYSKVDQTDTNYETKKCPSNHDYGMSQVGALYLVTEENYTYEEVLKYYYGEDMEILENKMQLTGNGGFVNPTTSINCTSPFGYRIHPVNQNKTFHSGIDIGVTGPIYAAQSGKVTTAVTNVSAINNCAYGYGNYIVIEHDDGTSTLYAHIKYGTIPSSIYVGATVSQGEQIGEVGSTGCSTGYHLHYEVKSNGNNVDPADYLDLTNAKGTCRNG